MASTRRRDVALEPPLLPPTLPPPTRWPPTLRLLPPKLRLLPTPDGGAGGDVGGDRAEVEDAEEEAEGDKDLSGLKDFRPNGVDVGVNDEEVLSADVVVVEVGETMGMALVGFFQPA